MRKLTTCRSECISPNGALIGIVTNRPGGYDPRHAYAAESVCARPECARRATRNVEAYTGEKATLVLVDTKGAQ